MSYNNRNNDYYEPKPDLEESTPWNELKTGISQKYQNPEDDEDMLFIDDEERFNIRERNYKEFLKNKEEKVAVDSKWDSFGESEITEEIEEVKEVRIKKDKKRKSLIVEEVELEEGSFIEEKVKSKKNKKSKREVLVIEEPEPSPEPEAEEESFAEVEIQVVEQAEAEAEESPIHKKKNKKRKSIQENIPIQFEEETSEITPEDIEEVPEIILKKKDKKSKKQKTKIEVQEEEPETTIIEPEISNNKKNKKRKISETETPSKKKNKQSFVEKPLSNDKNLKPNNKARKLLRKEQHRLAALNPENGESEVIAKPVKIPEPQKTFQNKPQQNNFQNNSQLSVQEEVTSSDKGKARCFGCRAFGHNLKQCKAPTTQAENICIKCGSKDHDYKRCYVHKGPVYNFAVCFSCKKMGHITSQCREKTNGIYPDGGNCRHCQSVDHLGVNCPQNRRRFNNRRGNSNNRFVRNGKTERRKY